MMAKTKKPKPKPHGRRYPWAKWFSRKAFTLTRADFNGRAYAMAMQIRIAARSGKYGYQGSVHIEIAEDGESITVTRDPLI